MKRAIHPDILAFTLLLGALCALPPMSIDMALPALSRIGESLGASIGAATLTLSVFMAGFSFAQLLFGPISDRFGRRPALLGGCALYTLASFACAAAPSMGLLLAARFFEGCGAGAGMAMAFAIVRDRFEGANARARLSYVGMVLSIAPMIAPTLGAWIIGVTHWRAIYGALGVGGAALIVTVYFFLEESLKRPDATALQPNRLLSNYLRVLRTRVSIGYILVNGFNFGCMFAYVAASSFLMMQVFGLSASVYGVTFACTALGIMAGAFVNSRLNLLGVSPRMPLIVGLIGVLACVLALLALYLGHVVTLMLFLPLLVASDFFYGLVTANAAQGALHPLPDIAGVAGASLGFVQMACGSMASALVARLNDGHSPSAMIWTMLLFSAASAAIYFLVVGPIDKRAGRRREGEHG
jgi:DHA1 family bicyclomycin/chloramphenicol resistance-like MFS transporter